MTALNSTNKTQKNYVFESAYLGLYDYQKAEALQNELHALAAAKNQFSVIGLEHFAVLTLGHRATLQSEVMNSKLPVVKTSRGGLATIHSEGQLVIYPIINLRDLNWGVKEYVQILLDTTRELLAELGVESWVDEQAIGLHTSQGKVAFCGIQVKNSITLHGISLNVKNDLNLFNEIKACGLENPKLDRLLNYDLEISLPELFKRWSKLFSIRLEQ